LFEIVKTLIKKIFQSRKFKTRIIDVCTLKAI